MQRMRESEYTGEKLLAPCGLRQVSLHRFSLSTRLFLARQLACVRCGRDHKRLAAELSGQAEIFFISGSFRQVAIV